VAVLYAPQEPQQATVRDQARGGELQEPEARRGAGPGRGSAQPSDMTGSDVTRVLVSDVSRPVRERGERKRGAPSE